MMELGSQGVEEVTQHKPRGRARGAIAGPELKRPPVAKFLGNQLLRMHGQLVLVACYGPPEMRSDG